MRRTEARPMYSGRRTGDTLQPQAEDGHPSESPLYGRLRRGFRVFPRDVYLGMRERLQVGGSEPIDVTDLAGFPGGGTTFLRDDATFSSPTVGPTSISPMSTDRLIGRDTAGSGASEEIPVSGGIEFTGGPGLQTSAFTGDVTKAAGGTALTIANDAVSNPKMADMVQDTIKGRASGAGTGDPTDLTATQATAILNNFVGDSGAGGTKGLVPAPAAGDAAAGKFLKADGAWTAPTGGSTHDILSATHTDSTAAAVSRGSLITGQGASPTWSELVIGASARLLRSDGTDASWAQAVLTTDVTGTLPIANGGTGQTSQTAAFDALAPTTTTGDLIYHNGTDNVALSIGAAGDVLTVETGLPKWVAPTGGGVTPKGYIFNLQMSNAADTVNDITVGAGEATDEAGGEVMVLASSITKQLDATWAVGTNAGGLNTGSVAANTWYEVHLIKRSDTGVVDVMFTTTANRNTLPTNYDLKRRIGWIRRNGSTILQFTHIGDHITLVTPINDVSATATASETSRTMTVPPAAIGRFRAACLGNTSVNAANGVVVVELAEADTAPTTTNGHLTIGAGDFAIMGACHFELRVNSSSAIGDRAITATGSMAYDIETFGWVDDRRRFADI